MSINENNLVDTNIPILVVDDLMDNLELMEALLISENFEQVLLAQSGREALGILDKNLEIGLVLLDLMMPEMDGYEVCHRIVNNPKTEHIPVIVITGGAFRQNEALVKSFSSGAVDYVQKPLNEIELFARIRVALKLYKERVLRQVGMRKIAESEERYRTTFDQAPVGIAHVDHQGRFLMVNESLIDLLAYHKKEILGTKLQDFCDELSLFEQNLSESLTVETVIRQKNGDPSWVNLSLSPLSADRSEQSSYIVIIEDITEKKLSIDKLKHMAFYDALTGLPNRVLFRKEINRALHNAEQEQYPLAVLFLDLDHFKTINDSLGHEVGDKLLQAVAKRIQSSLRRGDVLARLGGDEFALLLSRIAAPEHACIVAEKILDYLQDTINVEEHKFYIGVSIGISIFPQDGQQADILLKNADTAMYQAKELGRHNFQLFSPVLDFKVNQRLDLEQDLRRALQRKEFELYYQPQVDLKRHRIVGVEALLRWNHPRRGILSPNEYLPLAEETGLIVSVGQWVLETACQQAKKWLEQGMIDIIVYVNFSLRQFQQANLLDSIRLQLEQTKLPASHLGIEITESINTLDTEKVISNLQSFRDLGVKTVIDDFGMGYSSLSRLKHFPLSSLKIDKSFIQNACQHEDDAAIVKAIITLGKSFGLKVVAEGVETIDELRFVSKHGCDVVQGYLFSKPLKAIELEKLLQDPMSLAIQIE